PRSSIHKRVGIFAYKGSLVSPT
ncbi:hypothetical protein KIPB_007291, partial [Kipferlia bialata]